MNNEEILQQHNARLTENNIDLKSLFNKIKNLPNKVSVDNHYLEGNNVIIVLSDGTRLVVDISGYIGEQDLTEEQLKAINEMVCEITDNGELNIIYDDTVLDIDFNIENGELIIEDNEEKLEFTINENKEMEAIY